MSPSSLLTTFLVAPQLPNKLLLRVLSWVSTLCQEQSLVLWVQPLTACSSEPLQQHSGVLVDEWPAILGSDFTAVVISVGSQCKRLQPGDHVYSCAPIGQNKYTPFQDTFLVEEDAVLKKSPNLSLEDASTIGAGLLVGIRSSSRAPLGFLTKTVLLLTIADLARFRLQHSVFSLEWS